jgi:3-phenylpropionate/cinnamic acid dioxygenase small subunit
MTSTAVSDDRSERLLTRLDLEEFLLREAALLDDRAYDAWLELLAEDILYEMPVRVTREAGAEWQLSPDARIFSDDIRSLRIRVERLSGEFAWAEQPPSVVRHYVTNVLVDETERVDELAVRSNLLIFRQRGNHNDLISCSRRDVMRRVGDSFKIKHRLIALDETRSSSRNFSMFF